MRLPDANVCLWQVFACGKCLPVASASSSSLSQRGRRARITGADCHTTPPRPAHPPLPTTAHPTQRKGGSPVQSTPTPPMSPQLTPPIYRPHIPGNPRFHTYSFPLLCPRQKPVALIGIDAPPSADISSCRFVFLKSSTERGEGG